MAAGTGAGLFALQQCKGWSQLHGNEMEVRKLIRKSLQPARPIRRGASDKAPLLMVNFRAEVMDCCKEEIKDHYSLWCSIGQLNGILKDPVIPRSPETPKKAQTKIKQDRITYSRDFLIQLSSLSVSRQKPKYLPDHPVVLDRPLPKLCENGPLSSTNVPA
ncbi:uncharacterized protein C8orf88 homolog isoform X3 [Pyxicephalus adspersus]|uniref:Uncharacterized protein n=1 Tax=Pyxicephalus adspersus TaxID=30357 RepID=A0AAV3AAA8_PYXAD|nr:TPA: hypothetical protein GDO54_011838 [Pyxicephalus adspersus]